MEKINKTNKQKFSKSWSNEIQYELEKCSLVDFYIKNYSNSCSSSLENREADYLSHFILRLIFCQTEEMRKWFVNLETDLFKLRWEVIKEFFPDELEDFITQSNLYKLHNNDDDPIYEVPWTEAVHLVRNRNVNLKAGMTLVPCSKLLTSVEGVFRKQLSMNIVLTTGALPIVDTDGRLANLMLNIDKR